MLGINGTENSLKLSGFLNTSDNDERGHFTEMPTTRSNGLLPDCRGPPGMAEPVRRCHLHREQEE